MNRSINLNTLTFSINCQVPLFVVKFGHMIVFKNNEYHIHISDQHEKFTFNIITNKVRFGPMVLEITSDMIFLYYLKKRGIIFPLKVLVTHEEH